LYSFLIALLLFIFYCIGFCYKNPKKMIYGL
jgi:hypothetical protein